MPATSTLDLCPSLHRGPCCLIPPRTAQCLSPRQPFTHHGRRTAGGLPKLLNELNGGFCASWPIHVCMSGGVQSNTFEVVEEGIYSSPCTPNLKSLPIATRKPWCLQNGQICWSWSFKNLLQCWVSLHQDINTFEVETMPFLLASFKCQVWCFTQK